MELSLIIRLTIPFHYLVRHWHRVYCFLLRTMFFLNVKVVTDSSYIHWHCHVDSVTMFQTPAFYNPTYWFGSFPAGETAEHQTETRFGPLKKEEATLPADKIWQSHTAIVNRPIFKNRVPDLIKLSGWAKISVKLILWFEVCHFILRPTFMQWWCCLFLFEENPSLRKQGRG